MKVLFGTVVYNGVEKYFEDFFTSIKNQKYKKFDLYIINDGCEDRRSLKNYADQLSNTYIIEEVHNKSNPSMLRKQIIEFGLNNNYDLLVFGDSDDTFSDNRVGAIINNIDDRYGFYYNNLFIKGTNKDFFKGKVPSILDNKNELDKYNFIGMSNSAINLSVAKDVLNKIKNLEDCIAFDWYLYTLLLKNNINGKLVDLATTFYRIYEANIAGDTNTLTNKKLEIGLRVKKFQYDALKTYDKKFLDELNKVIEVEQKLKNIEFKIRYINAININFQDSVYWWQNIKTLCELEDVL